MLRTYQPKKLQRKKEHGFRKSPRPQKSERQSKAFLLIREL